MMPSVISRLPEFAPPGRLPELELLVQAWTQARRRKPTTVVLSAGTGIGKTRLVQALYHTLAGTTDPDRYWPATLLDTHKAMTIVPQLPDRAVADTPAIPWLWIALRCSDSSARNHDARGDVAFDVVPRQLHMHLAGLYRARLLRTRNAALAKSMLSVVASFALPGGAAVLDALENSMKISDTTLDAWGALGALVERWRTSAGCNDFVRENVLAAERVSLADGAIDAFRAIAANNRHAPVTPIVLVVDDAHWIDPLTADVLDRTLRAAWREGWPLLTILCAWDEQPGLDASAWLQAMTAEPAEASTDMAKASRRPIVIVHRLTPLDPQRMCDLVTKRCPGLTRECSEVLATRCSGDLDLLFDFLDELVHAPGWLDSGGELIGGATALEDLPSQALTMARQRLRSIDAVIVDALSIASAEGVRFHLPLVQRGAARADGTPDDMKDRITVSDTTYGITVTQAHALLDLRGEFRRHVYWEVCCGNLARLPKRRRLILCGLAEALRDIARSPQWKRLSRAERSGLGTRLLELVHELDLDGPQWDVPRTAIELDLAEVRLDLGDAPRTIQLTSEVLARADTAAGERTSARRLRTQAACMLGDVEMECRFLDEWHAEDQDNIHLLLCRAGFLVRQSAPLEAIQVAQRALCASSPATDLRVTAVTCLAHALWSAGQPDAALEKLAVCELEERAVLARTGEARLAVDHSLALVLHDLEQNVQVIARAESCVAAYHKQGRLEAELISRVNLGDALWGAGRSADALSCLEDAYEHADAAALPHAQDIAAICLANTLSCAGEHDRAIELYDRGIELGLRIGHDWDEMYGRAHRALCAAERDGTADPVALFTLAARARECRYHYLASLAVANAPLAALLAGDVDAARQILGMVVNRGLQVRAPGPAAQLLVVQVLVATRPSAVLAAHLLNAIDRCEGLKGRLGLALDALARIRDSSLLDPLQARRATRWASRFGRIR